MATKMYIELPDGTFATRTSENRVYTHAVIMRLDPEHQLMSDLRWAEEKDYDQVRADHAERVKNGYFDTWSVAGYCSRIDLANKLHNQTASEGRWIEVRTVEVKIGVPPKPGKSVGKWAADDAVAAAKRAAEAKPAPKPVAEVEANPTKTMYDSLYASYDHFHRELFEGTLTPVVLLVHRKRNAHGYFWQDQWKAKGDKDAKIAEIALNPDTMGRSIREVLSTLVHEMCHQWDALYGKVPSHGHGKTWGAKMDEVGLTPTSTGQAGGKRTGRKVTHMIVDGGAFDESFKRLIATGVDFSWFTSPEVKLRKRDLSKVKYTCPMCQTNIWAKTGLHSLWCSDCDTHFEEKV